MVRFFLHSMFTTTRMEVAVTTPEHEDDVMYTCPRCGATMLHWQNDDHASECPPLTFAGLPTPLRFAFLDALTELCFGAADWNYTDGGISVAVPNGRFGELQQLAKRFSLIAEPRGLYYFPLGSDQPPDHLRHECPRYPGSRGFWLKQLFRVKE